MGIIGQPRLPFNPHRLSRSFDVVIHSTVYDLGFHSVFFTSVVTALDCIFFCTACGIQGIDIFGHEFYYPETL